MRLVLATALLLHSFDSSAVTVNGFCTSYHGAFASSTTDVHPSLPFPFRRGQKQQWHFIRHTFVPLGAVPGADIEQETDNPPQPQFVGNNIIYRGKVNEIDYCIAPADVSLSRAYSQTVADLGGSAKEKNGAKQAPTPQNLSLTQALNNASNRAVRRILLAKCWPSEDALNMSLRLAAAAEKQAEEARRVSGGSASTAKCPVPRPILNLLMRRDASDVTGTGASKSSSTSSPPSPSSTKTRTNREYVVDQILAFRERYGSLAGYDFAEAYLESILSLATTGDESPRVKEVLESGVYDESYRRVISVLKSVGVVLESLPDTDRFRLAKQLRDQTFCLSMMDMLAMRQNLDADGGNDEISAELDDIDGLGSEKDVGDSSGEHSDTQSTSGKMNRLRFWKRDEESSQTKEIGKSRPQQTPYSETAVTRNPQKGQAKSSSSDEKVILCSEEPSMTRQLNGLSNIVHRGLLFGGDQELLVLSETLADNSESFCARWYPGTGPPSEKMEDETRIGVQYLNALISLLRRAYDEGVVTNLDPLVSLSASYGNSYERLMASLVEMGSGYIRPEVEDVMAMPKPRTAQEELGRFAVWEAAFRSGGGERAMYPDDLEGTWEVKDEVGGETIGISTVTLAPMGEVIVAPPLQGLRWRLDPGPTHLDTCTFQVLSEDGTVLQYRGFIDRGSRVEARFSGRSTRIRGSVMFQMRNGGVNYWKDMLPVNYKTGATKFEMTKKVAQS